MINSDCHVTKDFFSDTECIKGCKIETSEACNTHELLLKIGSYRRLSFRVFRSKTSHPVLIS